MPARTGQQYMNGLSENPAEVWIRGEKVTDVTTHSAFKNGVRSLAALYDMQHDMPARTGQRNGLSENPAKVWIRGEKVTDVTTHSAFKNGVRSLAALYDMQHDPATKDEMTFKSPSSGIGRSVVHHSQDWRRLGAPTGDDDQLGVGKLWHDGPHPRFSE